MQKLKSEPERALIADKQGMADIETIITQGQDWLKPNGWIVLEHGYDQGQAVQRYF
jgi:release factor glutamine methyltransferase